RLLRLPLGMRRGERLDAIHGERELRVHRLLGPERAVVVEDGYTLGGRYEVGRALLRRSLDEVDDGLPCRALVPGRQRIHRSGRLGYRCLGNGRARARRALVASGCDDRSHCEQRESEGSHSFLLRLLSVLREVDNRDSRVIHAAPAATTISRDPLATAPRVTLLVLTELERVDVG